METEAHKELKALAAEWAIGHGYESCGYEISLAHSGCRADVAAYKPAYLRRETPFNGKNINQRHAVSGHTAVFECKQCRSDLLNDACVSEGAHRMMIFFEERKQTLERLLKIHIPSIANGDSLFQEYQTHNFEALDHKGYRSVLRSLRALQTKLRFKRKFENLIRYGCANLFYLVTTENIIEAHELPCNWGWLVKNSLSLELRRKPVWQDCRESARLAILQRLAVAGNRYWQSTNQKRKTPEVP